MANSVTDVSVGFRAAWRVHPSLLEIPRFSQGTGQNNYTRTGPTLGVGGGGEGSQRHHLSSNITNNILLAFKFELTQEESALLDKQQK